MPGTGLTLGEFFSLAVISSGVAFRKVLLSPGSTPGPANIYWDASTMCCASVEIMKKTFGTLGV